MPTRIALVSCVKTKRKATVAAKDLYISPLFKGMRNYAEQNADSWFILSAKYRLLRPDEVIAPYELAMKAMPKRKRLAWAEQVQCQLLEFLPAGALVVILAGRDYHKDLVPFLKSHGFTVEVPMEGLGFGPRLRWLKEHMCDEQARR